MSRETDWHVFDKAADITASAVRGTGTTEVPVTIVGDLFREAYRALKEAADEMPEHETKAGF